MNKWGGKYAGKPFSLHWEYAKPGETGICRHLEKPDCRHTQHQDAGNQHTAKKNLTVLAHGNIALK
jgi:hypothetical protein